MVFYMYCTVPNGGASQQEVNRTGNMASGFYTKFDSLRFGNFPRNNYQLFL